MSAAPEPGPDSLDFSFTSSEVKRNPHPLLDRLRVEDPVHYVKDMDFWLVTRYEDIRQLFLDPRVCGDRRVWDHHQQYPEGSLFRWIDDRGFMAIPPEEHARQRRIVSHAFTPRGVARMDRQIREVVDRYAKPLHGRTGVVDLMAEFTTPIPITVISTITGVAAPGDAGDRFSRLGQETIQGFFGFVSDEIKAKAEVSFRELSSWVRDTIKARREKPEEDLITDFVQARDGDDVLNDDDIVCLMSAILAAGSETTAAGGTIAIRCLLDFPEATERLRRDRSLIPQAVTEMLRWGFANLTGTARYAREDFELRGKRIKKGQMLILSSGGASHDPEVYDAPHTFDIDRNPTDILTFGHGPHYCLGANLARGELACMVDAALDFLPPGAKLIEDLVEVQTIGLFDRAMNFPVDFGS
jgi:cytochrome P450